MKRRRRESCQMRDQLELREGPWVLATAAV